MVKVSTYTIHVFKVKCKYLIFKFSIAEIKTCLLVNNRSKIELIDEFFVYTNKILSFKLQKPINLHLETAKLSSNLPKKLSLTLFEIILSR